MRVQLIVRIAAAWMLAASVSSRAASDTAADAAASSEAELATIVITATRAPQPSFDLPMSVGRVNQSQIQPGQLQVNLSESLGQIPGVSVQSRQNYAQDLQMSVRGFGARSSFGVRGVRLYADGIPGTMPDGQGQFSQFDLGSAGHIEVLRGPFSALYGNSSGGVISIFTEDGKPGNQLTGTAAYGSFGTERYALKDAGQSGGANYVVDAAHFQTDGYRDHSAAQRNNLNAKVRLELDEGSRLTLVANAIGTPSVQDPLGLTRTQLAANPTQAGTGAILFNTRKALSQQQVGAIYERTLDSHSDLSATAYAGHRTTTQYQAIPVATEAVRTHPGGVIDLGRVFGGIDVHWTGHRTLLGTPLQVTAGASFDNLTEARKGYLNFIGTTLGVEGALRRDESNRVFDLDEYLQLQWDLAARWRAVAGVRNSIVDIHSHNRLPTTSGSASGVSYAATNPVAGITFSATAAVNLYASYGRAFETPTLNDLAYRSTDGSLPGLNLGLKAARSDDFEVGAKLGTGHVRADLAAFYVKTRNELATQANSGGRSVFENIGATQRRGLELGLDGIWQGGFSTRLAYTHLDATTAQAYRSCAGLPCLSVLIPEGNRLPAIPRNALHAELTWRYAPLGFSATLEALSRAGIYVDDRNSDVAAGYTVANLRLGVKQDMEHWTLSEFAAIDNLTDRNHVESVIVNESNSRFFEPAPGLTVNLIFTAAYR